MSGYHLIGGSIIEESDRRNLIPGFVASFLAKEVASSKNVYSDRRSKHRRDQTIRADRAKHAALSFMGSRMRISMII